MSSQEHAAVDWAALQYIALSEDLGSDQRWSTWRSVDRSSRGPKPRPGWLVTSEAALDTELGLLKTGKEADVFLIERAVPGAESCLLAAKRYRAAEHRLFHRASSYTEGRRGRDSRENRAVRLKSGFGRQIEDYAVIGRREGPRDSAPVWFLGRRGWQIVRRNANVAKEGV